MGHRYPAPPSNSAESGSSSWHLGQHRAFAGMVCLHAGHCFPSKTANESARPSGPSRNPSAKPRQLLPPRCRATAIVPRPETSHTRRTTISTRTFNPGFGDYHPATPFVHRGIGATVVHRSAESKNERVWKTNSPVPSIVPTTSKNREHAFATPIKGRCCNSLKIMQVSQALATLGKHLGPTLNH